jgi:DNA-binding NarL/FixJ family response regulator
MKVLIVDDHVLFREGLASILNADKYFKVVGQAGSVYEAIVLARSLQPDLILMDFSLPDGDGAEASEAILAELPMCKIVFLSMHDADENLFAAIRSGAKGYLLKNVPAAKLVSSLKSIEKGEAAISGEMTMHILEEFSQQRTVSSNDFQSKNNVLSQREVEIINEIAKGYSNDEIADNLFLSVNTVKHHVHNIFTKLGVENRRKAIEYAKHAGIMSRI